ncbi:uncharacterized protein BX664DRAFT_355183 [Halteromyces radiatus]|uniref:uncharacterized protein n=1 Tax=Halteromyces radiatus TaxID=101107 RepID=UPI0022208E7B|nr:uncharacterized protein BX664DRAFT_355183 [Halteromyces radiatus]KAI8099796.1 hypothetical protein BX664DRAFT_355183 [Halteromyces radiatus]
MHSSPVTATTSALLAIAATIPVTQARYLWHPNELPLHQDYYKPAQEEHHIVNFAAEPSFQNAETTSNKETSSAKKDPSPSSSHSAAKSADSNTPKSSAQAKPTTTPTNQASAIPHSSGHSSAASSDSSPTALMPSGTSLSLSGLPSTSGSSTPSSTSSSSSSDGTSSGAIAGIVIAVLAVVGAIAAFVMVRRKKNNRRNMKPDPFTMGFGSHDPPRHDPYNNNNNSYQYNNGGNNMTQPYQQPQPAHMPPVSPTYSTPPPPLSPMSDVPPYQQQQYYATVPAEKSQVTTAVGATNDQQQQQLQQAGQQQQEQQVPQGSLGVFNVVSTYSPTLSDEIDIQLGDRIEILVEYDDGWCQGINLTRGNIKGVFPRHCVEQYPGAAQEQQQAKNDGPPQLELGSLKRVSSMYMSYT